MFVFFVLMLLIATLTDKAEVMISESEVAGYADMEILLANDELSDKK